MEGGVGPDLGAVDRDRAHRGEPGRRAQAQHRDKDGLNGGLVVDEKPGDGGVIGCQAPYDHLVGGVAPRDRLDATARAEPAAIGIEEQRQQHLGVIGGAAGPVVWVQRMESRGVHPIHHVDHEPGQVAFFEPVAHVDRHEERLLPIGTDVEVRHDLLPVV